MTRVTYLSIAAAILIISLAASCAGGNRSPVGSGDPRPPAADDTFLGGFAVNGDLAESAAAIFTISIDPGSDAASTKLKSKRSGQQTDDLYELGIGNFISDQTLRVHQIRRTASTVELDYSVTHPFAAPVDLDAPPTRTNRADLAVVGRVVFLLDVPQSSGNTFFSGAPTGSVVANTELVLNNDGYFAPAGLLNLAGYTANTFPYKVLVDESLDPRLSQADGLPRSNGGSALGNYSATQGWQRDTIGPLNDGWTGYGVMHHGQEVFNTLTLDRTSLDAGQVFEFDAAIIVKYEDPRGGTNSTEKRSNRLPGATPDLAKFVYRHPHGSLDIERVSFVGEGGTFLSNAISASQLRFRVVDWDVYAPVTTSEDLSQDLSSASNVSPGEAGMPSLAVCIPGVLGDESKIVSLDSSALTDDDSAFGGDAAPDSGIPGDALFFNELVTKTAGSGQTDGVYTGMVRVADVENDLVTPYRTFLTEDLQPVTGELPRPIAYQHFQVVLGGGGGGGNFLPTLSLSTPANVTSGTGTTITVASYSDANGNAITVNIDWDNNGTYEDSRALTGGSGGGQVWTSPIAYTNGGPIAQTRYIPVRYTDGVMAGTLNHAPLLSFNIGPNAAPTVSLSTPATVQSGSGTVVNFTGGSDAEGDPISLAIDWDDNPGTAPSIETVNAPYAAQSFNSPILYPATVPGEVREIPVGVSDPHSATVDYSPVLSFTLANVIGGLPQVTLSTAANVLSGNSTSISVLSASDADNNVITLAIDWDDNLATSPEIRTISPPYAVPLTYVSPITYKNATLTPSARALKVTVSDSVNPATAYSPQLTFTLGPNRAPIVTGAPNITNTPQPTPATFTLGAGTTTATDPEGDTPITYSLTNNRNSTTWTSNSFPFAGLGPWTSPPVNSVGFTAYANDPLHPDTSGTAYPTVNGVIYCDATTPILSANFDTGMNGFVFGPGYTPSLFNNDNSNKSSFSRCPVAAYMGPSFSGNCLTTGPDGGACGVANDSYDQNVRNNVVSPAFSLVGRTNARLVFDSVFNGRPGVNSSKYRVYATSNGSTWILLDEDTHSAIPTVTDNVELSLAAYAGLPSVRIRFEFYDNSISSTFSCAAGRYAGWSIDNFEVYACP